jgi:poly(A) polymerase
MLKLFMGGKALANFEMLRQHGLFERLFPMTERSLGREDNYFQALVSRGMGNTDARVEQDKPVTPAFLFAVFLWQPVRERAAQLGAEGQHPAQAMQHAGSQIIAEQAGVMATPRRFSLPMREIWVLQLRLEIKGGRRSKRVLGHPRFRAAYDFLLLRAEAGEVPGELGDWWTAFQEANPREDVQTITRGRPRKRRRNRSRRKPEVKAE